MSKLDEYKKRLRIVQRWQKEEGIVPEKTNKLICHEQEQYGGRVKSGLHTPEWIRQE